MELNVHPTDRGHFMTRTLGELEAIVRERICNVCSDRTVEGECGLEDPTSCALFRLFPQVAIAVQSTDSNDIRDYIRAIREEVCSICTEQNLEGECESRKQVQCALDAYLLLVVDAIEEATGKNFNRDHLAIPPNRDPIGCVKLPEFPIQ